MVANLMDRNYETANGGISHLKLMLEKSSVSKHIHLMTMKYILGQGRVSKFLDNITKLSPKEKVGFAEKL